MHHGKSPNPRARAPARSGWAGLITAATGLAVLAACGEPFYCTPGAATWQVTVLDAQGTPVPDLRWTAVIERTHDTIPATLLAAHSDPAHGTYAVFTDAVRDRIDPTGEVVRVEGAAGTAWFSAAFEFAVPEADCYANRVSGPDTVTLAPAAFALVNADRVWGGGDVLVVSPVLRLVDSLPFLVEGDTAWSHAIAGDTAAVTAPVNTGAYVVEVVRGEAAESIGTVDVHGYGGFAEGPPMSGVLMRWPPNTPNPTFLGNGPNQLQLFDAASRTVVRSFPDSMHNPETGFRNCPQGIGPTYNPNAVVLCPEPKTLQAWTLEGAPQPFDVPLHETMISDVRMAALGAPGGGWLVGDHHWVQWVDASGGSGIIWIEEPQVMQISPRGNRIVLLGNGQLDGVVVLDTARFDVAYYIEELAGTGIRVGAGFSSDGQTLFAAVQTSNVGTRIAAVAAEDGEVQAFRDSLPLLGVDPNILVDPRGSYVFLTGHHNFKTVLIVLDAVSLGTVAQIALPNETCLTDHPSQFRVDLVLDQTADRVYAIWTGWAWQEVPPENSCIEQFDLR
jgi:hypothetical protein